MLRVNSADFEVGENDQLIREKQRPLILRALIGVKNVLVKSWTSFFLKSLHFILAQSGTSIEFRPLSI